MIGAGELLIIGFLFLTTINCLVTYLCSSSSIKKVSESNDYSKAITRLRNYDKYLLTTLTMITGVIYVALSYNYFVYSLVDSDYFITLATVGGFIFTLLTTFFSRLCYCYACNFILKTKLNEYECFMENMFSLVRIFFPIFVVSFIIPTIYVLPFSINVRHLLVALFLFCYVVIYVSMTTSFNILSLKARKLNKPKLIETISHLFDEHGIKKYKLYYWDSSRSNDSNSMVTGFFTVHFFISTSLIESINNKELEAVILHEIGHIKKNHIKSSIINQMLILFAISAFLLYALVSNVTSIYFLLAIMSVFIMIMGLEVKIGKKQEDEADLYVAKCGLGDELISALKKISYEGEGGLVHQTVEKRENNISKE